MRPDAPPPDAPPRDAASPRRRAASHLKASVTSTVSSSRHPVCRRLAIAWRRKSSAPPKIPCDDDECRECVAAVAPSTLASLVLSNPSAA